MDVAHDPNFPTAYPRRLSPASLPPHSTLLRAVARSWRGQLRVTDVLARYGGEEFAVAFPAWPFDAALPVVERLRTDIPAGQTCSAGLVAWDGKESAEELVGRADEAKRAGCDRTVARP